MLKEGKTGNTYHLWYIMRLLRFQSIWRATRIFQINHVIAQRKLYVYKRLYQNIYMSLLSSKNEIIYKYSFIAGKRKVLRSFFKDRGIHKNKTMASKSHSKLTTPSKSPDKKAKQMVNILRSTDTKPLRFHKYYKE